MSGIKILIRKGPLHHRPPLFLGEPPGGIIRRTGQLVIMNALQLFTCSGKFSDIPGCKRQAGGKEISSFQFPGACPALQAGPVEKPRRPGRLQHADYFASSAGLPEQHHIIRIPAKGRNIPHESTEEQPPDPPGRHCPNICTPPHRRKDPESPAHSNGDSA